MTLIPVYGLASTRTADPVVHHLADTERRLFAVSDGVRAQPGAQVASQTVIEQMSSGLLADLPPGDDAERRWLSNAFRATCTAVREAGQANRPLRDMTATLTLLTVDASGTWRLLHAGDSRAYLLTNGLTRQLTDDHTVAFEQYLGGTIPKSAVRAHPKANILTRSISASRAFVVPDQAAGELTAGDMFVLCSSAVMRSIDDDELEEILVSEADPDILAAAIVEAAETQGEGQSEDRIVLVVRFDEP